MTPLDTYLAQVAERAEKATPSYQLTSKKFGSGNLAYIKDLLTTKRVNASYASGLSVGFKRQEDAEFIAASRTDIPKLLRIIVEMRGALAKCDSHLVAGIYIKHIIGEALAKADAIAKEES